MIDFELARQKVLQNTPVPGEKTISFERANGYVLAEKIVTAEPIPLFDSSAVDGYALKYEDVIQASDGNPVKLKLIGTIRAGSGDNFTIKKNTAVKIFTGAPVPVSATAVVMKEVTEEKDGFVYIHKSVNKGQNIRRRGEEFKKGAKIFSPGIFITPPVVAMLATIGVMKIKVYKKPTVAIIITGDEIRHPKSKLERGQIRDSNSYALKTALISMGIENIDIVHVKDTLKDTKKAFINALKRSDVVISVGGISVGEYDLVKDVLEEIGVKRIFWSVAMKPGKPNYFGIKNKKLVFGLPGNPVSAMVSFYVLVRPALHKMSGLKNLNPFIINARLTDTITKKPGRLEFVRGIAWKDDNGEVTVTPTGGQDSHMIGGLASANCLIYFPKESERLEESSIVEVELLQWQ